MRFFDRGDYYMAVGADALFIANDFFHTLGIVKYLRIGSSSTAAADGDAASRLPYVCLSGMMYETALRELLLVRQYRVEVYARTGKSAAWTLVRKVCRRGRVRPHRAAQRS